MVHTALVRYILEGQSQPAWEEKVRSGTWLHRARAEGVTADSLRVYKAPLRQWHYGPASLIWRQVEDHFDQHKVVPTLWDLDRMIRRAHEDGALTSEVATALLAFLGDVLTMAPRPESFDWALRDTLSDQRKQALAETFIAGSDALTVDPDKAEEILRAAVRPQRISGITTLTEIAAGRWDSYCRVKAGEFSGTRTGITQFDRSFLGLEWEDFLVISARTNTGKSWLATLLALNQYLRGGLVVFVTGEHTAVDYANRMEGITIGVDPRTIRMGQLPSPDLEALYQGITTAWATRTMQTGEIVFANRGAIKRASGVADLVALTQQEMGRRVDLCIVDPLYALSPTMKGEDLGQVAKVLKQTAMDLQVPMVATHQDNRESIKNAEAGSESLYGSDVIGHEADWHWRLVEGPDGMSWVIKLAKVRKGPRNHEFVLMVDLERGLLQEPKAPSLPGSQPALPQSNVFRPPVTPG